MKVREEVKRLALSINFYHRTALNIIDYLRNRIFKELQNSNGKFNLTNSSNLNEITETEEHSMNVAWHQGNI